MNNPKYYPFHIMDLKKCEIETRSTMGYMYSNPRPHTNSKCNEMLKTMIQCSIDQKNVKNQVFIREMQELSLKCPDYYLKQTLFNYEKIIGKSTMEKIYKGSVISDKEDLDCGRAILHYRKETTKLLLSRLTIFEHMCYDIFGKIRN